MTGRRTVIIAIAICLLLAAPLIYFNLAWSVREALRFHFIPTLGLHNLPSYDVQVENTSALPVHLYQLVWLEGSGVVSQYSARNRASDPDTIQIPPHKTVSLYKGRVPPGSGPWQINYSWDTHGRPTYGKAMRWLRLHLPKKWRTTSDALPTALIHFP